MTLRFITAFTQSHRWTLFWSRWIKFTSSRTIMLWSILILSSHLPLCLPYDFLPLSFHTVYAFFITYIRAACEAHLITHSRYIRSTNHKTAHYATFSVFLSLLSFRSQYPLSVWRTVVIYTSNSERKDEVAINHCYTFVVSHCTYTVRHVLALGDSHQ